MATLRRCDQCGKVTEDHAETHEWIEVVAPGDLHHHIHRHFCSWQCVGTYAFESLDPTEVFDDSR